MAADRDAAEMPALRSIALIAAGDLQDFAAVVAPDAVNRESAIEPPACRVGGPAAFHATALWLRSAFADLRHEVVHVVVEDGLVAVDTVMHGRQTGPFVTYDAAGAVDTAWAPTGRSFAVGQTHWLRVREALVIEHWAVRDDLGQGLQLGWVPPSPRSLVRNAAAKRRAIREQAGT